jgi:hypothetical protein
VSDVDYDSECTDNDELLVLDRQTLLHHELPKDIAYRGQVAKVKDKHAVAVLDSSLYDGGSNIACRPAAPRGSHARLLAR